MAVGSARYQAALRQLVLGALLAVAVALALGLAACGDDDDGDAGMAAQDGETRRVVVESQDGAFDSRTIYDAAAPGVVTIRSIFGDSEPTLLDPSGGGGQGQGSGFVISDDGEVVTNAHVVTTGGAAGGGGEIREAREVYVQFADRNQVPAEVVGFDPFSDVALLKVDAEGLDLQPLPLGSENDVEVGEPVAAIGSPFGQQQSLSIGVVSASDRTIDSLTRFAIDGAIQTDASINPGNSGGPLLDAVGEVVGINQQINTTSGGNEGVGFAVPIDLAERAIDQLRENGEVSYAYIGVETTPLYPQLAERLGLDVDTGALISSVVNGGPADDAGLRAGNEPIRFQGVDIDAGGDVIVAVDGEEIVNESDLPRLISRLDPGDEVTLEIIRDGEHQEVEVTLEERPANLA
ncbi:MAG TPA: trypsin-like peptidase domain-containing protein [Solirubrobacterales bacterium]|jgi:S1-C subfamily serine protease|nr:trypsin-like peptidase domain-containing protein [Solirubrobacterales bacterium]